MSEQTRRAVVLLSGGLDSTTVLAIAQAEGYETHALSFSYGQRHSWELECARKIATNAGVKDHRVAQIDLRVFGGSALTADISVPKGRSLEEMSDKIPVTYVPARNTIFLSFALAWAEVLKQFRYEPLQAEEARRWSGHHTWTDRAEHLKRILSGGSARG